MVVPNPLLNEQPVTELDTQFSAPDAAPIAWDEALQHLEKAEIYWLSTVRPDGRPHVTPVVAVWLDGALHFVTGPTERKAKNLAQNAHCILTTGCNALGHGLDVVVEGQAEQIADQSALQRVATCLAEQYNPPFDFALEHLQENLVYRVTPVTAFGFGRTGTFSQTRWRFQ